MLNTGYEGNTKQTHNWGASSHRRKAIIKNTSVGGDMVKLKASDITSRNGK